jgi:hypothetical protein
MLVSARARFPARNADSNSRSSIGPAAPASRAVVYASFSWLRICASPSTIESRPQATRNACRIAAASSSL